MDRVSLGAGLFFTALAVLVLAGVPLSAAVFRDGGLAWVVLIGLGVLLLASRGPQGPRRAR